MKNLITLISFCFVLSSLPLMGQNSFAKANDEERIAIGFSDADLTDIPAGAAKLLSSRLTKTASLNGLAVDNEAVLFNMIPEVAVISKEVSPTAPPMITLHIELSVKLVESMERKSFEQVNLDLKGVGNTEQKAYTNAFQKVSARHPKLKAFFTKGKQKILEHYNGRCDLILAKADGYIAAKQYVNAYHLLINVPPVSRECYDACIAKIKTFGDKLPSGLSIPDPQVAPITRPQPQPDPVTITQGKRVELVNGLIIEYTSGRTFGEKTVLNLEIINPTGSAQKVVTGPRIVKVINDQGEEIEMEALTIGNKESTWSNIEYSILPGTPVTMKCVYPRISYVRQLVMQVNKNTYRLDRLPLN